MGRTTRGFNGAGGCLFKEMGQSTFALVVGSPSERTNHWVGGKGSETWKHLWISDILVHEIVEHQARVCVVGWDSMA